MVEGKMRVVLIMALLLRFCVGILPGMVPFDYEVDEELQVYANKLQSTRNKLPHQYHYAYPFCRSAAKSMTQRSQKLNLGQLLLGERHEFTNFEIRMGRNEECKFLCEGEIGQNMTGPLRRLDSQLILRLMQRLVDDEYVVRLNLDGLPVVMRGAQSSTGKTQLQVGYPFGDKISDKSYVIFNHFRLKILIHEPTRSGIDSPDKKVYRVVGFEVEPWSMKNNKEGRCDLTTESPEMMLSSEMQPLDNGHITFTYSVEFEESATKWATRWDPLLEVQAGTREFQWVSILNSILLTFFLTLIVGVILLKTVHNDFVRYNRLEDEVEIIDESGWKLVHGDVFRTPSNPELLSIACGTGAQLLGTFFVTLFIAIFGYFSPQYRGGLLTSMVFLWVFLSSISGFVAASMYNNFGGQSRRVVSLGSAFLYSGLIFIVFLLLNTLLSIKKAGAVPFTSLLGIIVMWFGLSVPLVLLGAFFGFRRKPKDWPTRTNQIPREIPNTILRKTSSYHCIATGLVPFGVVFMQLLFVLNSLSQFQKYNFFSFLFVVFLLVVITAAEVSITFTYLKLASEDYNWWWYSFNNPAFASVYVFIYSCFFYFHQTGIDWWSHISSSILITAYSGIVSLSFGLMVGYIGITASTWFVKKIYSSIRIE